MSALLGVEGKIESELSESLFVKLATENQELKRLLMEAATLIKDQQDLLNQIREQSERDVHKDNRIRDSKK